MKGAIAFAAVLALATAARAGDFCGSLEGPDALRELDRYAAGKGGRVHPDCFRQSYGDPLPEAVAARILSACSRAVTLAPARRSSDLDAWCALGVLRSGVARVGERDLVGELVARSWRWDGWPPYAAIAATGDPRARPFVLEQLARHRESWRKAKLRAAWAKDSWRSHELAVLAALEKVGTSDDLALIGAIEAEQRGDKRIAAAAQLARAAASAPDRASAGGDKVPP